jgi:hypothetical protein
MNKARISALSIMVAVIQVSAKATLPAGMGQTAGNTFYVYHDKGDKLNHFIPSGWMGDYGDLKINDANTGDPKEGKTSIKITYSGEAKQGANWAGIYWQQPANNWGAKAGGFDLSGYKRVTFWAKGVRKDKKPVNISEFKIGGITGEYSDSDVSNIGPVELTDKWKQYSINLA